MNKAKIINLSGVAAILIVAILAVGYFLLANKKTVTSTSGAMAEQVQTTNANSASGQPTGNNPFLSISSETTNTTAAVENTFTDIFNIVLRLFLSVLLAAVLAFRPRRNIPFFQRNLYVAQTQILLAVVAAALMMIVGDNTARAFAIFAAVSLVRFRTNIRDPKEITVLLISLALGLAAGVGRWELGLALCLFALALLWVLEYKESEQVFRSMQLTVKTPDTEAAQQTLIRIFKAYELDAEVRQIDPPAEDDAVGCVMYYVNLRLNLSTDFLSDKIFASGGENIDSIEWEQKKNAAYVYQ